MKNLNLKTFSLAIFSLFAASFCLVAILSDGGVKDLSSALVLSYKAIPLVLVVVGLFVSYMWRWRVFRGWLVPFPDISGTWEGALQTTWQDPLTGVVPAPIPVILTVKQSFTKVSCVMRTAEMTSRSFLADFWLDGDEQVRMLGYCYHSFPLPTVQHRSQPHDGTVVFEVVGTPVTKLKGTYWTGRKTTGEVVLTFRDEERLDEFPTDLGKHPVSGK